MDKEYIVVTHLDGTESHSPIMTTPSEAGRKRKEVHAAAHAMGGQVELRERTVERGPWVTIERS